MQLACAEVAFASPEPRPGGLELEGARLRAVRDVLSWTTDASFYQTQPCPCPPTSKFPQRRRCRQQTSLPQPARLHSQCPPAQIPTLLGNVTVHCNTSAHSLWAGGLAVSYACALLRSNCLPQQDLEKQEHICTLSSDNLCSNSQLLDVKQSIRARSKRASNATTV